MDANLLDETDRASRALVVHHAQASINAVEAHETGRSAGGAWVGPIFAVLSVVGKAVPGDPLPTPRS